MREIILNAFNDYKYFIGLHQLCRYLNGKGYIRYGCNAKYKDNINSQKKKTIKINPCKLLCINSNIYLSKLYYWIKKLEKENKLFTILIKYKDSKNPNVKTKEHITFDIFRFLCINKEVFIKFKIENKIIIYHDKIF